MKITNRENHKRKKSNQLRGIKINMRFKGEKAFSNQAEIVADKYFDAFKATTWPEDWINPCLVK